MSDLVHDGESPFAWREPHRLLYNAGMFVSGILAFVCYVIICVTLLPRVLDELEIDITGLTTLVQSVGYLFMMMAIKFDFRTEIVLMATAARQQPFQASSSWVGSWS